MKDVLYEGSNMEDYSCLESGLRIISKGSDGSWVSHLVVRVVSNIFFFNLEDKVFELT